MKVRVVPKSWRVKAGFRVAPQGLWKPSAWNQARMVLAFWLTRP